jgi:hypothetical protein
MLIYQIVSYGRSSRKLSVEGYFENSNKNLCFVKGSGLWEQLNNCYLPLAVTSRGYFPENQQINLKILTNLALRYIKVSSPRC